MYKIGLIDDELNELMKIRRTIKTNAPKDIKFEFKEYELKIESDDLMKQIANQVISDIKNNNINALIIDYKIMIETEKLEGTEILKRILQFAPNFPVVILTDVIEDSVAHDFVDPDKVYKKSQFFKVFEDYSKQKILNLFRNMQRYVNTRSSLEQELEELKKSIDKEGTKQETVNKIVSVESELDKLCPTSQSQIEKVFDAKKVKEILEILEKANKLMEK
ncbi:MAG: hypothetical protein HFJ41_03520 [Clostridia bacterium]|nr:hypothetical protein [Clostridia bacterium]